MFKILFLSGYFILLWPQTAFAYLDPGSGSALFASLIAAVTAGLYSLKVLYYRILGKNITGAKGQYEDTLLIFSEGKNYWGTFGPIVNELIKRKIHFRYVSIDVHDPGLTIEDDYMHSKLYGKSAAGFGKLSALNAPVMLSTTANIGSAGYPLSRSPKVKQLVHVLHALDTALYKLGALDFYDSVIMAGEHQEEYLRIVEVARNRPAKEMVPLGLPYLDDLYHKMSQDRHLQVAFEGQTVLVAPSWGRKGCLTEYGTDFLKNLAQASFRVILRLHPQSYISEADKVSLWKKETRNIPNLIWDEEIFSTSSMEAADILISDTSQVRFDFAFLHLKPVVTLEIPTTHLDEFESIYHEVTWAEKVAPELGVVVPKSEIKNLPEIVKELTKNFTPGDIISFRDKTVTNFGHSAEAIIPFLESKVAENLKLGEIPDTNSSKS